MSDENITDSQISNNPGLPPEQAEMTPSVSPPTSTDTGGIPRHYLSPEHGQATPSVTADVDVSNVIDLSPELTKENPAMPVGIWAGARESKELRRAPRFRVKWRIEIHVDEQGMFTGFVKDISTTGASIYMGRSLQAVKFVTLHMCVTPSDTVSKPRIVVVFGKIAYTVYDSTEHLFRAGVTFLKFNSESDLAFLKARLTNHHVEIPDRQD